MATKSKKAAEVLEVDEAAAVQLLKEVGVKAAGKPANRIAKLLSNLPNSLADDDEDVDLSKKSQKLLDQISEALDDGVDVVVASGDDDEEDEVESKQRTRKQKTNAKASANGKAAGKGKKTKARSSRGPAKSADKWGAHGEASSAINAMIDKKGTEVSKIISKLKRITNKSRIMTHLYYLQRNGYVKIADGRVKAVK